MKEIIKVESTIQIEYGSKDQRKEAIRDALTSPTTFVYCSYSVKPLRHKLSKQ